MRKRPPLATTPNPCQEPDWGQGCAVARRARSERVPLNLGVGEVGEMARMTRWLVGVLFLGVVAQGAPVADAAARAGDEHQAPPSAQRRKFFGGILAGLASLAIPAGATRANLVAEPAPGRSAPSRLRLLANATASFDATRLRAWPTTLRPALEIVTGLPPRGDTRAPLMAPEATQGLVELILAHSGDPEIGSLGDLFGGIRVGREGSRNENLHVVTLGSVIPTPLALHLARSNIDERKLATDAGRAWLRQAQKDLVLPPGASALVDFRVQSFFLWDNLASHPDDDRVRLQLTAALAAVIYGHVPALGKWRHKALSSNGGGPLHPLSGGEAGTAFLDRLATALGTEEGSLGPAARELVTWQQAQASEGKPAAIGGFLEGQWGAVEIEGKGRPAAPAPQPPREREQPQPPREPIVPVDHDGEVHAV